MEFIACVLETETRERTRVINLRDKLESGTRVRNQSDTKTGRKERVERREEITRERMTRWGISKNDKFRKGPITSEPDPETSLNIILS